MVTGPRQLCALVLRSDRLKQSRQPSSGALVIVGFLVLGVLVWLLRAALEPAPAPVSVFDAGVASRLAQPALPQVSRGAIAALPPAAEIPEPPNLRGHDAVDPCTAGWEPVIPPSYDTATALGITVAWLPAEAASPSPYDVALKPTAVAYLINGLLEEAAALTATARREQLTVIIYPSQADYVARTGAPRWSGGLYDGGAVRLPLTPSADLGVATSTLRHELMHAQLHTAVGCMPAWFNEGISMYFAGTPPVREWIRMVRSRDPFDLAPLQAPSLSEMTSDNAYRAYAESLAMIVFVIEHTGEAGLRTTVQTLQAAVRESPRAGLELWDRLVPGAGHSAVLDSLARKIFGVALGSELDTILKGAVCCYGLRAVTELGCRAGSPPLDGASKDGWLDRSGPRRAFCRSTW
jgi:hypothetical protein